MNRIEVPGKVMLSGEYAVLYGGTAAMMPVISRNLIITESNEKDREDLPPVVKNALEIFLDETSMHERAMPIQSVEVDYSQFYVEDDTGNDVKLGLGSSAAEAVGVIALRFERAKLPWETYAVNVAYYADSVHREAQGGTGSGADIAVCAFRVPLKFGKAEQQIMVEQFDTETSDWELPLNLVYSGQPADTRDFVAQFEEWRKSDPKAEELVGQLVNWSHTISKAWFTEPREEFFTRLDLFTSVLDSCAEMASIKLKTDRHIELEEWAKRHGGRAKPTGAGGGDMILLIGDLPVDELDTEVIPLT